MDSINELLEENRSRILFSLFCVIGAISVFITLLIHEFGHALTAIIVGGQVVSMSAWGFSLYPEVGLVGFSDGFMGYTQWALPAFSPIKNAIILMMGSGATLIVSIISIFLLYRIRPVTFFVRSALFYFSLLFLDMVTYTFGLRFSKNMEPLDAAQILGISEFSWKLSMLAISIVFFGLILWYFFITMRRNVSLSNDGVE